MDVFECVLSWKRISGIPGQVKVRMGSEDADPHGADGPCGR